MEVQSNLKVPFEVAIDRAGFGLYSYILSSLAGYLIIAFACIGYGSTIIVPTSACELNTTVSQQGLLASAPVVGLILGGIMWGYLADTRGRRSMLLVALLGGAVVNMLASLSVNWIMLMVLQFIASIFASGLFSMSMTLLSESVPMANRNLVVLIVSSIFLLAQGIMAVLAIPVIPLTFSFYLPALGIYWNSWRTLIIVYSLPSLTGAMWLFFMQESPKFVYAKGDDERALEILRIIHRINKPSSEELKVEALIKDESQLGAVGSSSPKDQIVPLFKAPLLKYTLLMTILMMFQQIGSFMVWLPTIANQFVTIIQTGVGTDQTLCAIIRSSIDAPIDPDATPCSLNTTSLLMVFGVGVLQSLVNIVVSTVVNKVGRRNIVIVTSGICGVCGVLVNLVPNAIGSAVLFAVLLLGIIVVGYYTAISVAIFPTNLRTMAVALPMTGGRIATFASIQILNILLTNNCDVGFYVFATLFGSSAIIALFLPDDRRVLTQTKKPEAERQDNMSNNGSAAPTSRL